MVVNDIRFKPKQPLLVIQCILLPIIVEKSSLLPLLPLRPNVLYPSRSHLLVHVNMLYVFILHFTQFSCPSSPKPQKRLTQTNLEPFVKIVEEIGTATNWVSQRSFCIVQNVTHHRIQLAWA